MDRLRLLAIGDVHLGRRSGRIPESARTHGITAADLGPDVALSRAVDLAIQEGVDLVVFTGDLIESPDDRIEAFGHLDSAVKRLRGAEIEVFAVAGNHDATVLDEVGARIGLEVLGSGGRWQRHIARCGIELVGWSFPASRHLGDPLAELPDWPREDDRPRIVVLHADTSGPGSVHAPVRRESLEDLDADAVLLGHLHRPDALDQFPVGYLGSIQGLDPTEVGAHGPWLIEIGDQGVSCRHMDLAPLRWERVEVELMSSDDSCLQERIEAAVLKALAEAIERAGTGTSRAVGVRVVLRGSIENADRARGLGDLEQWRELIRVDGELLAFVDKVIDEVVLDVDAEELGLSAKGLPAAVANEVLRLRRREPLVVDGLRRALRQAQDRPAYADLDDADLEAVFSEAERQALRAVLLSRAESS